jgi:hypothetical protein
MKKQIRKVGFAALLSMVSVAGASAATGHLTSGVDLCALIAEVQGIFKLLRTLAFVGAGFLIAGWAWGYISGGKEIKAMDEVKNKGVSMLIGFILLFGIGTFLQVLSTATGAEILGCITTGW